MKNILLYFCRHFKFNHTFVLAGGSDGIWVSMCSVCSFFKEIVKFSYFNNTFYINIFYMIISSRISSIILLHWMTNNVSGITMCLVTSITVKLKYGPVFVVADVQRSCFRDLGMLFLFMHCNQSGLFSL